MGKEAMLGKILEKIVGLPLAFLKALCDLVEKLAGEAGQEWLAEMKKFLRKENCWTGVIAEVFLKLISAGESLIIDPVNGTEVIAKAKKVFPAGIDGDFKRWGADEPGQATPETIPSVYEMTANATFSQMFSSLNPDVRDLCFTQHQIISFVEKYPNWLRTDGYGTFFLFLSRGEVFVAYVYVYSDGLFVRVYRFECSGVWYAVYRLRVVVPQLAV